MRFQFEQTVSLPRAMDLAAAVRLSREPADAR